MLRAGFERLDRQPCEASGGHDLGVGRSRVDPLVGHEDENEVVQDEVGPQAPGVLGPLGQSGDRFHRVLTARHIRRPWEGRHEGFAETPIPGVQLTDLLDHQAKATPRIGIGAPVVDDGATCAQLVREGFGGQHLLGREVTVQGGRSDPRTPRDLPHRHVQAVGGKQCSGRVEDALEALTHMQTLNPEQATLWREAGLMNMRLGRLKRAIDAFEGFVARAPEGPDREKIVNVVRELRERLH